MTLPEYIAANLERAFEWGSFDCVFFAANWAREKTGVDYIAGLPRWTGPREALRVIEEVGGLRAALDARLPRISKLRATDGDVGLSGRSICIFSGSQIVIPGECGLIFMNRMKAECAWSL